MKIEFLDYIEDIVDAMNKAEILTQDIDFVDFKADFRINFAVARALEIVGEAAKRVPESTRQKYQTIPWRDMAGMRDKIIHGYDNVDFQIMWDAVKLEIPLVKPKLKQILDEYENLSDK